MRLPSSEDQQSENFAAGEVEDNNLFVPQGNEPNKVSWGNADVYVENEADPAAS